MSEELERMATHLEALGEYKVLRRLTSGAPLPCPPPGSKLGLVRDVVSTDSDECHHEVIKLAMVRFAYTPEGEVLCMVNSLQASTGPPHLCRVRSPTLTGIDDAKVAGHQLDLDALGSFVAPSVTVLAHNAGFDRRFVERLHPLHHERAALGRGWLEG